MSKLELQKCILGSVYTNCYFLKNKETGETFVDRISVTESGTRYSKEFAAFLKETYGHIPDDLPYA